MIFSAISCAKTPARSPAAAQVQEADTKQQNSEEKGNEDGAFPKDWSIEEIGKSVNLSAVADATHVLAWKRFGGDGPLVVEYCLVLCRLDEDDWRLASLHRSPDIKESGQWELVMVHMGPGYKGFPIGAWVWHIKRFEKRPSNKDIYDFMDEHDWHLGSDDDLDLGVDDDSKLLGGAVCKRTWEAVLKEKPTRDFKPAAAESE